MASPVVAWYGIGSNAAKVITAEADSGWTGSLSVDIVNFIEGAASLGEKVSAATVPVETVDAADVIGEPFDFSVSGGNDGDHLFGWLLIFAAWDTQPNGGFGLTMVDDLATDSTGTWYVGPQAGYVGGWASYVINPAADFDIVTAGTATWTTNGNPAQLSGVDGFGCRWKTTVSITGNTNNAFLDAFAVGQGYRMTLGDAGSAEGTFADFITFEETTATGRFGGLRNVSGILFAKCKLAFGVASGAGDTEIIDSGFTVVWEQQLLSDEATSAVASGFYELLATEGDDTTIVDLSAGSLSAVSPHTFGIDFSGVTAVTLDSVNIDRADPITLDAANTWTTCKVTNSGLIDLGSGAEFSSCTVTGFTGAADESAILWDVNLDPDGDLDGLDITMAATATHAIEFGANAPLTMTLRDWTTTGYSASDGNNDSTFLMADRGSDQTWTINVIGGVGNFSFKKVRAGDTVNIVIDPVTFLINVKDENSDNLQNANLYIKAADGTGPLPFEDTVTIARASTLATVSHTGHGMASSDKVKILGITDKTEDNAGVHTITLIDADSYSYVTTDSGSTSYTGAITSTWVALQELTDASGNASISKTYTSDQPIDGHVRISTTSVRYKTFPVAGDIDNADGLTINVQLIPDE